MELKVEGLQKHILDSVEQCSKMQQFWLRQQNELVRKTRTADEQAHSVDSLKKQLLILDQKKLRTDGKMINLYFKVCTCTCPPTVHVGGKDTVDVT